MQVLVSIPDKVARQFYTVVPLHRRSTILTRLIKDELNRIELSQACVRANRDKALARDVEDWQGFDDPTPES